jgi:MFS family permease
MNNPLAANIWKIFAIQAVRWFMLSMPIMVLFFLDNGLSMSQVLILQACFSLVLVAAEVPSGYFSDLVGRKPAIVIGCICGFLGYLVYSLSYGFWGFLLAEVALGISAAFISGADSALLFDSLAEMNQSGDYQKYEGRKHFFESGSEGVASVLGGFIALVSLRLPFYVQAVVLILAIPIALSLVEPKHVKLERMGNNLKEIWRIIKFSFHENAQLKWLIIYSSVISASGVSIAWLIQPYFLLVGLPLAWFGIIWALLQFVTAITALEAYKIENFLGKRSALVSMVFLIGASYIALSQLQALWAIAIIAVFYFVRGINTPVTKDYVNQLIPSEIRATVLSLKGLLMRLIFSIVGPVLGWVTDLYSFQETFLVAAAIFFTTGLLSLVFLRRHRVI